jgi:hypothetical protein
MRWAGHVARMGEKRSVYRVLVGKPEGKRQLGRPRRRCERTIKMDIHKLGFGLDRAGSVYGQVGALVNAVMNFRVP